MTDERAHPTRAAALLARLSLSQPQLARWLRVSQATVHRLANGVTPDDGPASKLLDQLQEAVDCLGVDAARELVLKGAVLPERIADATPAERPSHLMQAGFGSFS